MIRFCKSRCANRNSPRSSAWESVFLLLLLVGVVGGTGQGRPPALGKLKAGGNSFTVPRYTAFSEPVVNAYLYNPEVDEISLRYPFREEVESKKLEAILVLSGSGLPDGPFRLVYKIQRDGKTLYEEASIAEVHKGWFEREFRLKRKFPEAQGVSWEFLSKGASALKGYAALKWSRFQGQVEYLSGEWRSTYIDLIPVKWGAPGRFKIPVSDDGSFETLVPARAYAVVNVNGTGCGNDALERWT